MHSYGSYVHWHSSTYRLRLRLRQQHSKLRKFSGSRSDKRGVDVTAVADKLKDGIEFKDELAELDEAKIEKIIGISADSYTKAKVYVSSSGGTAEEIDCFEAKDADSAKAITDTLTARVESQKKVFENYVPEEMTKLNDPVLVTNGNYVYLCLSNDNDKAKEIIG
ncbi:DUF4358 domain-containing protein [Ruminococcus sp. AM31-15AC]|nr:DUF4358 domain-containing protein [Ruminococcus sp. AM31-15AC]